DSIRLIITSPPYFNVKDYGMAGQIGKSSKTYEHYIESMLPVWKECYRILKPNGKLCINTPIMPMEKKVYSTHYNRDILNINNDVEQSILRNTSFYRYGNIIWDKGSTDQLMMGSYPYPPNFYLLNTIEYINIFVKDGQPEKISKTIKEKSKLTKEEWREYISTIWKFAPERNRDHPAPFPVELPIRLIKMYSFVDDIIVDPFMGSGTTAIAAVLNDRKYIGYEINPNYVEMSNYRLDLLNQGKLFIQNNFGKKPDYEFIEILKKMMNDQYFDETEIMDKMQKGQPVEEILKYLYTQFKS
ncbi:MAG: site-specific DNA-methyltransferase, partial [Calditrichaceae bacterium]